MLTDEAASLNKSCKRSSKSVQVMSVLMFVVQCMVMRLMTMITI